MEARRHGWLVGAVAALALGAFAPAAGAATANITDDGTEQVLHFDAAAGEVNNLWIEGGPQWQLAELKPADGVTPPVHITGDANCHAYPPPGDPIGADAVSCDTPDGLGGIDRVEINLGDQDDVVQIIAADVPIVINGGDGKDTFYDTDRTNVVLPVPRTFNGGLGDDLFVAGVDSGQPNDYHGDDGVDKMYYHWRSDSSCQAQSDDHARRRGRRRREQPRATTSTRTSSTPSARTRPTSSRAPRTATTSSAAAAPTRSTASAATTGCSPTTRPTRGRRSATPTCSTAARVPTSSRWAETRRRTAKRATTSSAPSRSRARLPRPTRRRAERARTPPPSSTCRPRPRS